MKLRYILGLLCSLPTIAVAQALAPMPTSGSCSLMVRYEIPYGIDAAIRGAAGYPFTTLGTVTFKGDGKGDVATFDVNVDYSTRDYPTVRNWGLTRGSFTVEKLKDGVNGIEGSYLLTVTSLTARYINPQSGASIGEETAAYPLKVIALPANNGKTIFLQGATEPFSGVCQF